MTAPGVSTLAADDKGVSMQRGIDVPSKSTALNPHYWLGTV